MKQTCQNMATNSGATWASCIKPLLSLSGSTFNRSSIILVDTISCCENEILRHEDDEEAFYSTFVVLSTHAICSSIPTLLKSDVKSVTHASKILLDFLLQRLTKNHENCSVSQKQLMTSIKSLCSAGASGLSKSDVVTFVALLKAAKIPAGISQNEGKENEDSSEKREIKRPRLDTGKDIFTQLTSVFNEVPVQNKSVTVESPIDLISNEADSTIVHAVDTLEEVQGPIVQQNVEALQQLNGSDILLNVCANLVHLKRYQLYCNDAIQRGEFNLPSTLSEASTIRSSAQQVLNDVSIVSKVVSLPVLEPLNASRLEILVSITMSCLYAAISATIATSISSMHGGSLGKVPQSKDEEQDSLAASIVQKSLEVLGLVRQAIRQSARAGGHHLQNVNMLGSWLLQKGMHHLTTLNPSNIVTKELKVKPGDLPKPRDSQSTTPRPGSAKGQSMIGVHSVALFSNLLTMLSTIMDDLQIESMSKLGPPSTELKPADLELGGDFAAKQRVLKLTSSTNLVSLFFSVMGEAFKKGMALKKLSKTSSSNKQKDEVEVISDSSSSSSDSNTYYEDDFSSSDDSSGDDDDDSEPILGQWFEDTLSADAEENAPIPTPPNLPRDPSPLAEGRQKISESECLSYVPDKKEPDGYIGLAGEILEFMTKYFLCGNDSIMIDYMKSSLGETHIASIATIVKELDTSKPFEGNAQFEFSTALSKFCHNLISTNVLPESLQDGLLQELGLSPTSVDPWPLTVYPRSLAVLAEILLLRLQQEREAGVVKSRSEMAIINIWTRFLAQLKDAVTNFDNDTANWNDINVEHAQLLIFLFHSLPLMQKKLLLLQLAQCVVSVAENFQQGAWNRLQEMVPLPLSRLLLVLDYLLHNFYDPPAALIEQVQWNLFGNYSSAKTDQDANTSSQYFVCKEVEDNYVKNKTNDENKEGGQSARNKPRFYNLAPADYSNQDTPKVDGLACSFLLSSPDVLTYDSFYDSCIMLLATGSRCDKARKEKFSLLDACSVQYHMTVCWRLLGCLPPSASYLGLLEGGSLTMRDSHVLHTLRWVPRMGHKAFQGWTKDYLVKQGLTTQKAEALVTGVVKQTDNVNYDVRLALQFIQNQIAVMPMASLGEILPTNELPSLFSVYMLDAVIVKVRVSLDDLFTKSMSEVDPHKEMEIAQDLLRATIMLIEAYTVYIRSCLLGQINGGTDVNITPEALQGYGLVMSIGSGRSSKVSGLGTSIMGWLPSAVRHVVDGWTEIAATSAWNDSFTNAAIPVENYLDAIQSAHLTSLSNQTPFTLNASLKHVFQALITFCADLIIWCPDNDCKSDLVRVLFPLLSEATTEYVADKVSECVERVLGPADSEEFTMHAYDHILTAANTMLIHHATPTSGVDERVLQECLGFMEQHLEKPSGKVALQKFFTSGSVDLINILLSASRGNLSPTYGTKVLKFFNKLFQLAEKTPNDKSYEALCISLSKLATIDTSQLQGWLSSMIMGSSTPASLEDSGKVQENRLLLQSLTTYIVKENSLVGEEVACAILNALIPMGSQILSPTSEAIGFSELMVVMATLAGAGSGAGHVALFQAATGWLELCKTYLAQKNVMEKLQDNVTQGKHQTMLESACYLLSYIGDILSALKHSSDRFSGAASPPFDGDVTATGTEADSDWMEEINAEEEDSAAEDSDEESLNNKLCTFTITQKEFMNQHWYHCHTCQMVDGVGVCTVCAKVCHKDHDLSYAKYGSFFCDCGAKEDASCQALVKRSSSGLDSSSREASGTNVSASPFCMETMLTSSLRRKLSSPGPAEKSHGESKKETEKTNKAKEQLSKQIEAHKDALLSKLTHNNTCNIVIDLLQVLMPSIVENYQKVSPLGSSARAQKALEDLKMMAKSCDTTDTLMTATLGSQEGAFENVRMNYSGDQGQTIRQLITSHMLRRVAMCCLTSPHGKRQHLAVSHEKGKVTILQLSALLKQADSSKRKLTLTRLASAPIPFTVLSISGNPCNEDYLAVCGLKDCHVLTFTGNGSVSDHLVLHPTLETGNFIIKALWLPGSQTELAIVTADFVKIYDLSIDALSPQYYFLLPSGKIRDTTFVFGDDKRYLVLMSSSGYIYTQQMDEQSSAKHGSFYITNILEVKHSDIKETNSQVAGGGVSVYYSHSLQLLFFSFAQGKNFCASIQQDMEELPAVFPITFKSSNGGKASTSQPLVQWTEVANHPGLVCSMTQSSNNPVILMIKPDSIQIQEIKVLPAKAKIQDMVAIRHTGSNTDQRTTLILLCEDGSLRIFMANVDQTNYWMSPSLQPHSAITVLKPAKKKKAVKTGRPTNQVNFPIDFFEHCTQTNDIDFGGNDVLQVYNTSQIKNRLNTNGMYIAASKPSGFNIEINNTNSGTVMMGIRVGIGSNSLDRCPSYLEIFGRNIQVTASRSRWIDVPFLRDESLQADKKITLFIGASVDPAGITIIDSIKVYVKTKETFGWPEDTDEFQDSSAKPQTAGVSAPFPSVAALDEGNSAVALPLTSVDRLLSSSLEVLDGMFATQASGSEEKDPQKQTVMDLATQLLTLPTPNSVQLHTRSLLASLFSSKAAYHTHKDQAQLAHVLQCLGDTVRQGRPLDPEAFQQLVLTARSVAVARPANLVRFAERDTTLVPDQSGQSAVIVTDLESQDVNRLSADDTSAAPQLCRLEAQERQHFMVQLVECFWRLLASRPANPAIAPVCLPGLTHVEATVGAIVEIIHAFSTCDLDNVNLATKLFVSLLMSQDTQVSFACKQAMIRVMRPKHRRRRVYIPSPPRCSTPGGTAAVEDDEDSEDKTERSAPQPPPTPQEGLPPPQAPPAPPHVEAEDHNFDMVEPPEPMVLEPPDVELPPGQPPPSALEALLAGGAANFQQMLDISPDADDEAMVELAIALSLQDQPGAAGSLNLQGLGLGGGQQASLAEGHLSDTTASAPGSDDEVGSTAATDGSTLRTSPAEHGGSAGSESGGSNVDSVSMSGRSSAYGETAPESVTTGARSETSSVGMPSTTGIMPVEGDGSDHGAEQEADIEVTNNLHAYRLQLLQRLILYMAELREVGGVRAIPYMQVILMLTSDLDSEEDKDKSVLDSLLANLVSELHMSAAQPPQPETAERMSCRTLNHEVQLVIMRLLSVLMSRTKAGTKPSPESSSSFISMCTASALLQSNGLTFCLGILTALLSFWKKAPAEEEEGSVLPGQLLKPHPTSPPPDMSPFFLRQYVKGHATDVFEDYPQLLTEMVLRLPYQMKKIAESNKIVSVPSFEQSWFTVLADYMMIHQPQFVRRQVRKVLLYVCGTKDKYRQLRDVHALESHMGQVRDKCTKASVDLTNPAPGSVILPYDVLISLIEHLKACSEIASSRTMNWQRFCLKDDSVLPFLVQTSIALDEGVAPVLLQLLQCALCGSKSSDKEKKSKKDKENKEKSEEKDKDEADVDESMCNSLVQSVSKCIGRDLLMKFTRCFLLESNATSVRWQAHALILHIYRSASASQQETLLELMWSLWPELPAYGRKASQFVDLLGYFALKTPQTSEKKTKMFVERAVAVLRGQNKILANHPNGSIYNMLQGLVDFDGFYLESDPCLVCNNPEVPYSNIKLSSIKVDSKFTTTTQIVKLVGSHTISKIQLRISDLKRTKMVRVMNVYYNNRSVQAVVELKNRPGLWNKAKKVVLTAGQTEVKIEFPLPIVACNLLVEYCDFYDNLQASTETLQCPRCSASVPANPGVCGNCGENVFQCHKCRAINYDEKDPFLCNACGFCKYAKFDFSLTARPCCAVDPIESEDDRKKAVGGINSLLEKADRLYKQLQLDKPVLEALLIRVSDHGMETLSDQGSGSSSSSGVNSVNKAIQQLAQRYCGDCKNSFDELSKIIQKVLASRKELVEYDRQQREAAAAAAMALPSSAPTTPVISPKASELFKAKETLPCCSTRPREKLSYCYGCASATVEHCITLLRALATNSSLRSFLCNQGLIRELLEYNLRRGPPGVRADVRQLICLLTKDNPLATEELNLLLTHTVAVAIKGHRANTDFAASVRHEMLLLTNTVQREDSCWEQRVRCVLKLFLFAMKIKSPVVLECIALPCLRILHHLIKPDSPSSKKNKDKQPENLCSIKPGLPYLHVDVRRFMAGDPKSTFNAWRTNMPQKPVDLTAPPKKKKEDKPKDRDIERRIVRVKYLMEKYGARWRDRVALRKNRSFPISLVERTWLRAAIFSASSQSARHTTCSILEAICQTFSRKKEVLDMLSGFLDDIGRSGESSNEFLGLFKRLIADNHWKLYLAVKGVPLRLGLLITAEIDNLTMLEESTLSSDLSQGFALKALTELLATFLDQETLKQHYKSRLVGTVLNGYLSLRKLVVQRTKLIDETQEKLLELLEDMTTGTESETKEFMSVCVETIERYPLKDNLSPVFIFERLCSIIYPEENDVGELFMSLEKDPQQEDFLQGRMLGNPYCSNEPGLGPLMRDVKNKICQDCELVALLEDDTGMELLVCNKIISLDLPVKDVYKKIWVPEHGEGEPMRIVYRMRGLLGDATEDMINTLDSGKDAAQDEEEVYRMAAVMSECGGLAVMLKRLAAIRDLVSGRQLMLVLLKLMAYCVKVQANRHQLIKPEMNTISIMLGALNIALLAEQESGASSTTKGQQTLSEQILQIMETILQEASHQPPDTYKEFSKLCGDKDQLMMLLDRINSAFVRANTNVLEGLMRLIPFLAFGDQEKMLTLVNHFKPYLDYMKYDVDHSQDEQLHLECFCVIADGIKRNANGDMLKDLILDTNIVKEAISYIQHQAPPIKTLLATDSEDWKDFISKPALPFILRILAGLSKGHEKTAVVIGREMVPMLHKLEQVSSDEHVGTLAENLLDAVREHPTVAAKIEDIRQQTKAEKKRLAMAMRQKQLKALGMNTNEKGQVTVKSSVLKQMEELKEETGLTCCICREGNRYHPTKVLGIYTYTKRINVEDFESKPRKTQGYTTVSHFNVVHIDCHLAAVRHARGREEWESAALQNANTRCNGLLPLWGPEVPESAFASCLARHNTYLQECTSVRDANYSYTLHDLKHIFMKFATEKSFSEDSGGGGRQSNMHLAPYLMHMALYVMNTTRSIVREEKNLANFLKAPKEKWVENAFETEGAQFYCLLAGLVLPKEKWKESRLTLLKRLVVTAHARQVQPGGGASLTDKVLKDYSVYKPYLAFLALVDGLYTLVFKKVSGSDTWSSSVADYIRHNDQELLTQADRLLASFEQEILPSEDFLEYFDVMGLLEEIPNPDGFMTELLNSMP